MYSTLFSLVSLGSAGSLHIESNTGDGSAELFPFCCVLDCIVVDSHADSCGDPAYRDSSVLKDSICAVLEIDSMWQSLCFWHDHVSHCNIAILHDSQGQLVLNRFSFIPFQVLSLQNICLNILILRIFSPSNQEIFVSVANPSLHSIYLVPFCCFSDSGVDVCCI